ncbi:hypothetical protein HY772_08535 [Candidatus Woesearchaeota archaeon]|nr:hypothetical protein [Candidatus Woesearchaeota archaeon]
MQTKKAQAAMEFLMTYGWAILVVLVAISALAYFGVLSPSKFLPERCTLPSGIACLDHKATATSISLRVQNGLGVDITGVTLSLCNGTSAAQSLANGAQATFAVTCSPVLVSGNKFSSDNVSISYTNSETGLSHTKIGSLTTKVE